MNPYHLDGPALISFSGGRTSGLMLYRILEAHGGELPADAFVAFANTGKERPETLAFVHDCETRFGVRIYWIEYRPYAPGFEIVGANSASRAGEPFQALIDKKQRLPNWRERWCTELLKVKPITKFMASCGYGAGDYQNVIGLRYDEGHRILKGLANADKFKTRVHYPLSKAKVTKADVLAFWQTMPFNLALQPWEGNCDLCFLKGRGIKKRIIRDNPECASWWANNETDRGKGNGWFDRRDRITGLIDEVRRTPELFDAPDFSEEFETECGLYCGYQDNEGEAA